MIEKLTKTRLRKMITDQLVTVRGEAWVKQTGRGNRCHSGDDGEFSDCEDKGSASLPDIGQYSRVGRQTKADTSACGRKNRKRYCKNGLIREEEPVEQSESGVTTRYLKGVIQQTVRDAIWKALAKNNCSMADLLRGIDTIERAQKGKLKQKKV